MSVNLFELLQSDHVHNRGLMEGLLLSQNAWFDAKTKIDSLFSKDSLEENFTFQEVDHRFPHLVSFLFEYHLRKLKEFMEKSLKNKITMEVEKLFFLGESNTAEFLENFTGLLQNILELFLIHRKVSANILRTPNKRVLEIFQIFLSTNDQVQRAIRSFLEFHLAIHEEYSRSNVEDEAVKMNLRQFFQVVNSLSLDEKVVMTLSSIIHAKIDQIKDATMKTEEGRIGSLKDFMSNVNQFCLSFLEKLKPNPQTAMNESDSLQELVRKVDELHEGLCRYVFLSFGKICISSLFDIILDFPETLSNIFDLKEVLSKTNLLYELDYKFQNEIKKRLLIPGVLTQYILNQYINILKALQIIDPDGLIFEKITTPIKEYLLKRTDTLRCIISLLNEDSESYNKMVNDFLKIPSKNLGDNYAELSSDDDEEQAEKWEVLPLAARKKESTSIKYKESDLMTILINLYGSPEAFISEYQYMLAEKLLSPKEYNIDEEIKNIELLKMRFGENNLQGCSIIVRDVKDSKRVNNNIHQQFNKHPLVTSQKGQLVDFQNLNCIYVSKSYWPINYEHESIKPPESFSKQFEVYSKAFTQVKPMRKLLLHYELGYVDLSLTFDNGSFEFKCQPIHAMLISFFDETRIRSGTEITPEVLSKELGIPPNIVKQKMSYWVYKGVIKEVKKNVASLPMIRKSFSKENPFMMEANTDSNIIVYVPIDVYEGNASENLDEEMNDENDDELFVKNSNMANPESAQYIKLVEGLIISMLVSNGPKSAEKIHNLLKTVYKTDIVYVNNENQTKELLRNMVSKQRLAFNGEQYSVINSI
eukprot:TRINITY_DN461_c0_g1_i5.p1 TRINITY_DN461_c0_g1~~TRINITY_DN461_c0_g1_i5.p1  ORF type:complete len:816 (-),score=203.93 TRINITY_DN461_c0_g1_i5:80-2527(-)